MDRWAGVIRPGLGRISQQREKSPKVRVLDSAGALFCDARVVSLSDLVPRLCAMVVERGRMSPLEVIEALGLSIESEDVEDD